ncbi:MAG: hypothetical protein ABIH91_03845 [Candidatus Omnitrophota bacterium]
MIIILGLDGLDYSCVRAFNCRNLMQCSCGQTDLSGFQEIKTIVLWSSFLAEMNLQNEINRQESLWGFSLPVARTFFSRFAKYKTLDVPGFSYQAAQHQQERQKLKDFFEKKGTLEEYDQIAFRHYQKNKEIFLQMLDEDCDLQMGYFALADVIGHLSFGVVSKMKIVYQELDELAAAVAGKSNGRLLILSDHGMEPVGRFGDHSRNGFWSSSTALKKECPEITRLFSIFLDTLPKVSQE